MGELSEYAWNKFNDMVEQKGQQQKKLDESKLIVVMTEYLQKSRKKPDLDLSHNAQPYKNRGNVYQILMYEEERRSYQVQWEVMALVSQ